MFTVLEKIHEDAKSPTTATKNSVGWDLYSIEDKIIQPRAIEIFRTGLKIKSIRYDTEIQIRSRSGLSIKHGVAVVNSPGTIDPDYEGEILVALINHLDSPYHIKKYDRIAQMVFATFCCDPIYMGSILEENRLKKGNTERNSGGIGSSGK